MGFHKRGALPVFLQGLLSQVFDASVGTVLEDASPLAVHAIRQVCLIHKKLLLPCSTERERKAYDSYLETDRSVRGFDQGLSAFWTSSPDFAIPLEPTRVAEELIDTSLARVRSAFGFRDDPGSNPGRRNRGASAPLELVHFRSVARLLWGQLFTSESFRLDANRVVPRHGPGATAERLSANRKFAQQKWHSRLDHWFPADAFLVPNSGYIEELNEIQFVPPEQEMPVRVITVPKTLKSPRIIAIEPACMQYTQQAIMEILVDRLECYSLTKGRLNFTDQTVNQSMALKSSRDGAHATIDLKDASDRVSAQLVWEMLENQKDFRSFVFSCRSLRAEVPGHGIIPLHRFASMGSALCFPIEAMVFYTIVASAIHRAERFPLTLKGLLRALEGVRVYGDDIIVPVEYVPIVKSELEWFNLRVNTQKTFQTGKFRESCGLDAFNGVPVTPVYCRRMLPTSRHDAEELISAVSLANQLYFAGYWHAATYVRSVVERLATVPYVSKNSSVLGWNSYLYDYEIHSWDKNLHRWLVRARVVETKKRRDPLDGPPALMKFFLKRGRDPYRDEKHLERYGRPLSVYTKMRWAQPY